MLHARSHSPTNFLPSWQAALSSFIACCKSWQQCQPKHLPPVRLGRCRVSQKILKAVLLSRSCVCGRLGFLSFFSFLLFVFGVGVMSARDAYGHGPGPTSIRSAAWCLHVVLAQASFTFASFPVRCCLRPFILQMLLQDSPMLFWGQMEAIQVMVHVH